MAVWRTAGTELDLDEFLAAHPSVKPDAVWRNGDQRGSGRPPSASTGFNLSLGEAPTSKEVVQLARRKLEEHRSVVEELNAVGSASEVDFAVMVGTDEAFVAGIAFEPDDLRWFADLSIAVTVTAYPVMEDDEE